MSQPRLLIFVIAYQAEKTLVRTLERIPAEVFESYACEVLVVDDASKDRTFSIGRAYKKRHPEIPMHVLRNQRNQGYGGNQKVGYAFAIERGFDFVAMVHGDGQYAPEALPQLVGPLARDEADAVFGSRMMTPFGALKGGMPLYKYVGNKILTKAQNALLRSNLSEFHSGYRVYRVATLKALPLELNSNVFHFDTEIIIQLMNHQARILELAIPTFYGDEISRVNGLRYAKDVIWATLQNTAHRAGILYQRRFDTFPEHDSPYSLKLGYTSSDSLALDAVPDGAHVLDLGADPDGLARELVDKGCEVTVVPDVDGPLEFALSSQTHLLLLDVIEHVRDPEAFLHALREKFDHTDRTLILSTPNVAFFVQRLMLLFGQFNYGRAGVLDRTHTRLFTFRSMSRLLLDEGFDIQEVRGVPAPFPKALGDGMVGRLAVKLNEALIEVSPSLFAYQIFVVARCRPTTAFVLNNTLKASGVKPARLNGRAKRARPSKRKRAAPLA